MDNNLSNDFSFREDGVDSHGNPVCLGERDSDGILVGYIDIDGTCWESLEERDVATTMGRFWDQWLLWNKSGGLIGSLPDAMEIAQRECLDPDSVEEAAQAARDQIDPRDPVARMMMVRMAQIRAQAAINN